MSNEKRDLEIEHRLTNLEEAVSSIKNNHLVHLQGTVDKVLWWIIGGFTTVFGALVIHGILSYLKS